MEDYQQGSFDRSLMAYQPLINGKEVGLLEALRVRAETKRQAAAIHAYRVLQQGDLDLSLNRYSPLSLITSLSPPRPISLREEMNSAQKGSLSLLPTLGPSSSRRPSPFTPHSHHHGQREAIMKPVNGPDQRSQGLAAHLATWPGEG